MHSNMITVQVSQMFGGLALCSLEAVVAKDGKEFIIEVNDCAMGLLGESQEDDRRNIAEVVIKEMEVETFCVPAPLLSLTLYSSHNASPL